MKRRHYLLLSIAAALIGGATYYFVKSQLIPGIIVYDTEVKKISELTWNPAQPGEGVEVFIAGKSKIYRTGVGEIYYRGHNELDKIRIFYIKVGEDDIKYHIENSFNITKPPGSIWNLGGLFDKILWYDSTHDAFVGVPYICYEAGTTTNDTVSVNYDYVPCGAWVILSPKSKINYFYIKVGEERSCPKIVYLSSTKIKDYIVLLGLCGPKFGGMAIPINETYKTFLNSTSTEMSSEFSLQYKPVPILDKRLYTYSWIDTYLLGKYLLVGDILLELDVNESAKEPFKPVYIKSVYDLSKIFPSAEDIIKEYNIPSGRIVEKHYYLISKHPLFPIKEPSVSVVFLLYIYRGYNNITEHYFVEIIKRIKDFETLVEHLIKAVYESGKQTLEEDVIKTPSYNIHVVSKIEGENLLLNVTINGVTYSHIVKLPVSDAEHVVCYPIFADSFENLLGLIIEVTKADGEWKSYATTIPISELLSEKKELSAKWIEAGIEWFRTAFVHGIQYLYRLPTRWSWGEMYAIINGDPYRIGWRYIPDNNTPVVIFDPNRATYGKIIYKLVNTTFEKNIIPILKYNKTTDTLIFGGISTYSPIIDKMTLQILKDNGTVFSQTWYGITNNMKFVLSNVSSITGGSKAVAKLTIEDEGYLDFSTVEIPAKNVTKPQPTPTGGGGGGAVVVEKKKEEKPTVTNVTTNVTTSGVQAGVPITPSWLAAIFAAVIILGILYYYLRKGKKG